MNSNVILPVALASGIVASLLFYSCGGSDEGADGAKQEQTVANADEPFTLSIDGATIDAPAGAFPEGAKVAVKEGEQPAEFGAANAEAKAASKVLEITATDKDGAAINQATVPLTIAIDTSTTAALVEDLDYCAFGFSAAGKPYVWRLGALKVDGANVAFLSIWLGRFQIFRCGKLVLPGFLEVGASGDKGGVPGVSAHGACQIPPGDEGISFCYAYTGKLYADAAVIGDFKSSCESGSKGTWTAGGTCAGEGSLGLCVFNELTDHEYVWSYYSTNPQFTAEALKASCSEQTNAKYYEAGTFTPGQNSKTYASPSPSPSPSPSSSDQPTAIGYACGQSTKHACEDEMSGLCTEYGGTDYDGTDISVSCSGGDKVYRPNGCLASVRLGCCRPTAANGANDVDFVFMSGGSHTASTAETLCTSSLHGTWTPEP
jgi:hypothetical protein